jgi:putative phage-type endonuclease
MRETIPFTTKEAWLEARSHDLTSTEAAVLFGKSPYMTLPELFDLKRNQQVQMLEQNQRMTWGIRLQDSIAAGAAEDNGWTIRKMDEYIRDTDLRIGSSFDFEATLHDGTKAILEVKNVDGLQFRKEWVDDEAGLQAPVHIELQVQHQMLVSGHSRCFIVALVGGNDLRIIDRGADPDVQGAMKYKIAEFWKNIDTDRAPDLDFERDADFILSKYRTVISKKCVNVDGDPQFRALVQAYTDLGEQKKQIEDRRKGVQAHLVACIGDAEKALGPDFSVTTSVTKDGRSVRVNWR